MSVGPRKVRLADVRSPDMCLVVLNDQGDEVEYVVRGQLTVEEMVEILQLQKAMQITGDTNPNEAIGAVTEASALVTKLVKERHPDAPDLNLGMQEVMMGFSALMGGVEAAYEFASTLTAGLSDEYVESAPEVAADADPTSPSVTPLSPSSEPLVSVTGGTLTGGVGAPGDRSSSPSIEQMSG